MEANVGHPSLRSEAEIYWFLNMNVLIGMEVVNDFMTLWASSSFFVYFDMQSYQV